MCNSTYVHHVMTTGHSFSKCLYLSNQRFALHLHLPDKFHCNQLVNIAKCIMDFPKSKRMNCVILAMILIYSTVELLNYTVNFI